MVLSWNSIQILQGTYAAFTPNHWEFFLFCGLIRHKAIFLLPHHYLSSSPLHKLVESDALILHDFPSIHACFFFGFFLYFLSLLPTHCTMSPFKSPSPKGFRFILWLVYMLTYLYVLKHLVKRNKAFVSGRIRLYFCSPFLFQGLSSDSLCLLLRIMMQIRLIDY